MPRIGEKTENGIHLMLRPHTPLEDYREQWGLWVKREDLACLPPGPPFSKTRGVYAHLEKRPEKVIGVLDTFHSQAGHAVARACQILGKKCLNYYPVYKRAPDEVRIPQQKSHQLGAKLMPIQAGRSCILYHAAKKETVRQGGYMMPNALKLSESITETAKQALDLDGDQFKYVLIPASSGTIAAGVMSGLGDKPTYLIHMGYSRSKEELMRYLRESSSLGARAKITLIDEGYDYKDVALAGETPEWPCNEYYDLKAFRWWVNCGRERYGEAMLWNIG